MLENSNDSCKFWVAGGDSKQTAPRMKPFMMPRRCYICDKTQDSTRNQTRYLAAPLAAELEGGHAGLVGTLSSVVIWPHTARRSVGNRAIPGIPESGMGIPNFS